jgi:hypothetical protein
MTNLREFLACLDEYRVSYLKWISGDWTVIIAAGLSGRIFTGNGQNMVHRADISEIIELNLDKEYHNSGGLNIWPAPEGGPFGWAYLPDDRWKIQRSIDGQDFQITQTGTGSFSLQKSTVLTNRNGIELSVLMERDIHIAASPPETSQTDNLSLTVRDTFTCSPDSGILVAPWTLEQFPAHDGTVTFGVMENPAHAINTAYYDDPHEYLEYQPRGFLFFSRGDRRLQLGLPAASNPRLIGLADRTRELIVVRRVKNPEPETRYFNIADNEQPDGPWSASDRYSIFNSDPEDRFLELETIGGIEPRSRRPLPLTSETIYTAGAWSDLIEYCRGIGIGIS